MGGGDVKKAERENGRTVHVRAADPTSQLKRGTAGLHGKLQPARDRRLMVATPSPRRWGADEY